MPKTSKLKEYEVFKKFLNDIESGKEPQIITETYIVISRKEYDLAQERYMNWVATQKAIYSKIN